MTSLRSIVQLQGLAGGAALLALLAVPSTARAESCADTLTFVTPWATFEDGSLTVGSPVALPVDVRPLVHLWYECTSEPETVELALRRVDDGAAVEGTIATEEGAEWSFYELAPAAPLEPLTAYELCFREDDASPVCVTFDTSDASSAPPPEPPSLTILDSSTHGSQSADLDVEVTWTPFTGAVWVEARNATQRPTVVAHDASAASTATAIVTAGTTDEELCVVAVARAADGTRVESEPSCIAVGGGCSLGVVGRGATADAAWLVAALGLAACERRRRASALVTRGAGSAGTRRARFQA